MTAAFIWLTKLVLSHLLTDFILQPKKWVQNKMEKHFESPKLYLHGFVTTFVAMLLLGLAYWWVGLLIFTTHVLIDGWKSYQPQRVVYFVIDQLLHFVVILFCWFLAFFSLNELAIAWKALQENLFVWKIITAIVFLTSPAGILIGQLTKQWRNKLPEAESLANAGKWIGIVERIIILVFVLYNEYSAIGLLIAAKAIIRFNEKDRPEIKTEYLVVGTLMSIALAILTGHAVNG